MDLASAEYLQDMRPAPLEVICYHCQQSAEKHLKGYLAFQGEALRKTHDLVLLNKQCLTFDQIFQTIENECLELTDYGVNVRYPFSIEVLKTDMEKAIESARLIGQIVVRACRGN